LKNAFVVAAGLLLSSNAFSQTPVLGGQAAAQRSAREVTVAAIPGVVEAGAKWKIFWTGLNMDNADGIVGAADGGVIFAQRQGNKVRKVDFDGKTSVLLGNTDGAGSLGIDHQGRIVAVMRDHPSVAILTPERKLLTDNYYGVPFKGASDLVVERRGGLYFVESGRKPTPGVYYLAPDGKLFFFGDGIRADGIALSPDEKTLYVSNRDNIVAIDLLPDGTGSNNRRESEKLQGQGVSGDGMTVDAEGRIYVSTRVGVQVMSPQGKLLGVIASPRGMNSVAFSGPDKKTLFIIGLGAVDTNGVESTERNAKTIYGLPMVAQGFKGRAK
jgi:gluconolactonase